MLRSLKDLEGYTVRATDGDIGCVVNFLMDDERWAVRYLVVETGGLLKGRRVLISPIAFGEPDWAARKFPVTLTVDRVINSPGIDTDKPVSRQHEQVYNGYYGNSYYWGYAGMWGLGAYPSLLAHAQLNEALPGHPEKPDDVHLRSATELRGYHVQGSDAAIGHVEDFIVDDETWAVRYLVVDTSHWWFGKKVLVAPHWATRISWDERTLFLDMSRQSIKDSPQWTPAGIIDREFETHLYDYYGRPVYWSVGHLPVEEESPHHVSDDPR